MGDTSVGDWRTAMAQMPQIGRLCWIGLRPARGAPVQAPDTVLALADRGLQGDRYSGRGRRQVTLIQQEHLSVIGALLGAEPIEPGRLRRNLVVSGINLLALKQRRFCIGDAVFEFSGLCHPCTRMEAALGVGGLNAMRGHGGINARILKSGSMRLGDPVTVQDGVVTV